MKAVYKHKVNLMKTVKIFELHINFAEKSVLLSTEIRLNVQCD